jgi:hypothetical protein
MTLAVGEDSSSQTYPFVEEEVPFLKTSVLERAKMWPWVSTKPETKIDSAGEGQMANSVGGLLVLRTEVSFYIYQVL